VFGDIFQKLSCYCELPARKIDFSEAIVVNRLVMVCKEVSYMFWLTGRGNRNDALNIGKTPG